MVCREHFSGPIFNPLYKNSCKQLGEYWQQCDFPKVSNIISISWLRLIIPVVHTSPLLRIIRIIKISATRLTLIVLINSDRTPSRAGAHLCKKNWISSTVSKTVLSWGRSLIFSMFISGWECSTSTELCIKPSEVVQAIFHLNIFWNSFSIFSFCGTLDYLPETFWIISF